jgi:hypothetical protein
MLAETVESRFFDNGKALTPGQRIMKTSKDNKDVITIHDFVQIMSTIYEEFNGKAIGGLEEKIDRFSLQITQARVPNYL